MYGIAVLLVFVGVTLVALALIELVATMFDRADERRERDDERRELRRRCWQEINHIEGSME